MWAAYQGIDSTDLHSKVGVQDAHQGTCAMQQRACILTDTVHLVCRASVVSAYRLSQSSHSPRSSTRAARVAEDHAMGRPGGRAVPPSGRLVTFGPHLHGEEQFSGTACW
jgi:hypothetical protein